MHLPAPTEGRKLLDVGAGGGGVLLRMQKLGWEVQGVDPDPVAVSVARSKGLNVAEGDLAAQGYPDGSFDCVTMNHVLEHVHRPIECLLECRRVLKPGGILVTVVPNIDSYLHSLLGRHCFHLESPRHLFMYGHKSLSKAFKIAGFETDRLFTAAVQASRMWGASLWTKSPNHWALRPLPRRMAALGFQAAERVWLNVDPWIGEEVAIVARKSRNE